jgi:hypothetical protein
MYSYQECLSLIEIQTFSHIEEIVFSHITLQPIRCDFLILVQEEISFNFSIINIFLNIRHHY